jgi:hypothetical protein
MIGRDTRRWRDGSVYKAEDTHLIPLCIKALSYTGALVQPIEKFRLERILYM